jgi:hypothetical protein
MILRPFEQFVQPTTTGNSIANMRVKNIAGDLDLPKARQGKFGDRCWSLIFEDGFQFQTSFRRFL